MDELDAACVDAVPCKAFARLCDHAGGDVEPDEPRRPVACERGFHDVAGAAADLQHGGVPGRLHVREQVVEHLQVACGARPQQFGRNAIVDPGFHRLERLALCFPRLEGHVRGGRAGCCHDVLLVGSYHNQHCRDAAGRARPARGDQKRKRLKMRSGSRRMTVITGHQNQGR